MIGKKAVTKSGAIMGKIKDVIVTDKGIQGYVIGKTFIDKEYVKEIEDAIMLTIDPITSFIGKWVFDADGRKLGKVKQILRKGNRNNFEAITIKKKMYSKEQTIPKTEIAVMKKNIILNKSYE